MNYRHGFASTVVLLAMTACGRSEQPSSEVVAKQIALYQQAIKNQERDHQRTLQAFDGNDALQARGEALMKSQEEIMKRQAADFDRFERILDTWEKQQAQYQRYLDSLKK